MHTALVEIYSDQSNAAVMRHPSRRFPGVLVQGDSLHALCAQIDSLVLGVSGKLDADELEELDSLRSALRGYLEHYKAVLTEHQVPLPFAE